MKKWSLILLVLLPIFFHDLAQADVLCNRCSCDYYQLYSEICSGVNFLQTKTKDDIKLIYDPGYIVEVCIGIHACYDLRLEAEFAYRRNSLNKVNFFGQDFPRHGYFESFSYMGNVLWDIPWVWDIPWECVLQPYIGGGIGYDFQQTLTRGFGLSDKVNKKDFAWQVIAGLKYVLPCSLDISLEYKFHQGGFRYIYCHSLGLCLTYEFGL
jgi:opacity protein-like surface antigen